MTATVTLTPDTAITVSTTRMTCTCKWMEKCYANVAPAIAREHIRKKHTKGLLVFHDELGAHTQRVS